MKVVQLMACGYPGGAECAATWTASAAGVMALSESFFKPLNSWQSEGLFGQSFSIVLPIQALTGLPCLGSSVVWHVRHIGGPMAGVLLCCSANQSLKGALWVWSYSVVQCIRHVTGQPLYCSAADAGLWGERGYGDGSTSYA